MADSGGRNDSALRGLAVGLAALFGVIGLALAASLVVDIYARRQELHQTTEGYCANPNACGPEDLHTNIRAATAAEDMVDIALWQITLNVLGLAFVAGTLAATLRTVRETQASVALAREDFIATHRPRIRVRFFQDDGSGVDGVRKAWITFANVGDSKAIVTAIGGGLGVRARDTKNWNAPGINASAEGRGPPPNNVLKGGESRTYWISSPGPVSAEQLVQIVHDDADLIALGEIRYVDENGTLRHTAFFWRWNPKDREFSPLDEPGRNYED